MVVVTEQLLSNVRENAQAIFKEGFDAADAANGAAGIVGMMPSQSESEIYTWFGTTPLMRDVTGRELEADGLNNFSYTRKNLLFKAGIWVERRALEDDKLGQLPPRFSDLGREASRFKFESALAQLVDNPDAYDGITLFNDTRVIGASANIDNNLTAAAATGTTPTATEMQDAVASIYEVMLAYQDDNGRAMGLAPDTFVVSPANMQAFIQATSPSQATISPIVGPDKAPKGGTFQVGPYRMYAYAGMTSAAMVAMYTQNAVKPIFWQERSAPAMENNTDPNSEMAIVKDLFLFSARMRGVAGIGDPRHAVLFTWT